MIEFIASIVLIGSVAGAGGIIVRKMPQALRSVEMSGAEGFAHWFGGLKNWLVAGIKRNPRWRDFSWLDFSQKQLLKIRVAVLKVENKIGDYTDKLRQRAQKQQKENEAPEDNYWRDLKNIVKTKQLPQDKNDKNKLKISGYKPEIIDVVKKDAKDSAVEIVAISKSEPMVNRVAIPEKTHSKTARPKKKRVVKKKKTKDPFAW